MSNTLLSFQRMLDNQSLDIVGYFNPDESDNVGSKVRTILLIGPKEPYFWDLFEKIENTGTIKKYHSIDGQKGP